MESDLPIKKRGLCSFYTMFVFKLFIKPPFQEYINNKFCLYPNGGCLRVPILSLDTKLILKTLLNRKMII